MTLICFASQKGSPGTSAAALAVAAALRPGDGRRKLLLEADLSGGVLAIRYRLPTEPGLVTLAAAARAGLTDDELWRHVGELPGGLPAVVCPDGPDQVHSSLAAAGTIVGRHLAERTDVDVICDLGRLLPGSPAVELAGQANALLMVARPTAEQLQPAARRMLALRPQVKNLGWLLIGEKPHGPGEVESTFGFPVVGVLADDRRSVEAIEGGAVTRRVRRHPFVRSAATVASTLSDWLAPMAAPPSVDGDHTPADPDGGHVGEPRGADRGRRPDPLDEPTPSVVIAAAPTSTALDGSVDDPEGEDSFALAPPPDVAPPPPAPRRRSTPDPVAARDDDVDRTVETVETVETSRSLGEPAASSGIEPPRPPAPPVPPPPPPRPGPVVAPDPFVHDDGDVEWTGS